MVAGIQGSSIGYTALGAFSVNGVKAVSAADTATRLQREGLAQPGITKDAREAAISHDARQTKLKAARVAVQDANNADLDEQRDLKRANAEVATKAIVAKDASDEKQATRQRAADIAAQPPVPPPPPSDTPEAVADAKADAQKAADTFAQQAKQLDASEAAATDNRTQATYAAQRSEQQAATATKAAQAEDGAARASFINATTKRAAAFYQSAATNDRLGTKALTLFA